MKTIKKLKSLFTLDSIVSIAIFLTTFFIYLKNLSPSVYGGDSGDILTAAITKGVPHPSGYPTITMLGYLFSKINLGSTLAWRVGLISVVFSSLTVTILYSVSNLITKNRFLAVLTAFTLAFLYPFWLYAEVVEVFALNSFFIILLIYLTLKYSENKNSIYLYLLAFTAGLSLTNNQVILLLFPAIALYIVLVYPKVYLDWKLVGKCVIIFFLGLTPYLYIPIAAANNPPLNWGNAVTFENFLSLITRKQYGWWNSPLQEKLNPSAALKPVFLYWKIYISPILPAISVFGVFELVRQKKWKILIFLFSAFVLLGPFFMIYGHRSNIAAISRLAIIERFIIQSALIIVIFLPFGILFLMRIVDKAIRQKKLKTAIQKLSLFIFLLIPATAYIVNVQKTNLSDVYLGDNIGKDVLESATKNSILLLYTDNYIFNSIFVQNAYNVREDVTLAGAHSGFSSLFQNVGNDRLEEYKIRNHNLIAIEDLRAGLITTLPKQDVLMEVGGIIKLTGDKTLILVPHGLLQKLYFSDGQLPTKEEFVATEKEIWSKMHLFSLLNHSDKIANNLILSDIKAAYILSFLRTANFVRSYYKDENLAKSFENDAQILAAPQSLDKYKTDL